MTTKRIVLTNYDAIAPFGNIMLAPKHICKYITPDEGCFDYAEAALQPISESFGDYFCFHQCSHLFWANSYPNKDEFVGGFVQIMGDSVDLAIINETPWPDGNTMDYLNISMDWIFFDSIHGGNLAEHNDHLSISLKLPVGLWKIRSLTFSNEDSEILVFFHAVFNNCS